MATGFDEILLQGLKALELEIDEGGIERLAIYFRELKKWSRKINLVSRGARDQELVETHFLDSLTLLPMVSGDNCHLLDIGSGAGFPGLVLKCVLPQLEISLVEPRLKRVSFLRHVIRTAQLQQATVYANRIEDERAIASDHPFTHITSRAVTEIGDFLRMSERFMAPGVKVICMKGPKWKNELDDAADIISGGFRLLEKAEFELPLSKAERCLLVFGKETA